MKNITTTQKLDNWNKEDLRFETFEEFLSVNNFKTESTQQRKRWETSWNFYKQLV